MVSRYDKPTRYSGDDYQSAGAGIGVLLALLAAIPIFIIWFVWSWIADGHMPFTY